MATTKKKRNATVLHMLVAMAVLFVPVILITQLFTRNPEPPITPIDWKPVAQRAAADVEYEVLAPANLPEGWIATRARYVPTGRPMLGGDPAAGDTFQLGFLSPEQRYFAIDQRDIAPEPFVASVTREGSPQGSVDALGRTWERMVSEDGRTRSLVSRGADAVTIVSGDLPYEALEAFATTLEPVQP